MKKLPAAMLIFVMILTLLTACGNGNTASTTPPASSDIPGASASPASSDKPESTDSDEALPEMGELLLLIDGVTVTLPITVDDFKALGWVPKNEEQSEKLGKTLEVREETRVLFDKGDSYIIAFVANLSEDQAITVSEGSIYGFENIGGYDTFELPGGIVEGVSTRNEVIAAYGESEPTSDDQKYMKYYREGFVINLNIDENDIFIRISPIRYRGDHAFEAVSF